MGFSRGDLTLCPAPRAKLRRLSIGFRRFLDEPDDAGDVGDQLVGYAVSRFQVLRVVAGEPNGAVIVLPCECFEWQVESDTWRSHEQWRSGLGISEDQHLHWAHREAGSLGVATEVNSSKHGQ